ncbi:DUF2795 domain-containing protein [Streptomyces sp. NPDC003077]|uniref:DUF2795 domain-containing protein n=1 Tax=Streptomyces sp. NPDC003077 TaxID=3154443 RepID=UPI0033A5CEBF
MTIHGRDKTGPLRDDEAKRELQGELKANRSLRVEEAHELQPPGEDQPRAERSPETAMTGGTPPGMTGEDVQLRSEMARHLGPGTYPAKRSAVLRTLKQNNAPDRLLDLAEQLPEHRKYANVQEIVQALGRGTEDHRHRT